MLKTISRQPLPLLHEASKALSEASRYFEPQALWGIWSLKWSTLVLWTSRFMRHLNHQVKRLDILTLKFHKCWFTGPTPTLRASVSKYFCVSSTLSCTTARDSKWLADCLTIGDWCPIVFVQISSLLNLSEYIYDFISFFFSFFSSLSMTVIYSHLPSHHYSCETAPKRTDLELFDV